MSVISNIIDKGIVENVIPQWHTFETSIAYVSTMQWHATAAAVLCVTPFIGGLTDQLNNQMRRYARRSIASHPGQIKRAVDPT